MKKKKFIAIVKIVAITYGILTIVLFLVQEKFLFHPVSLHKSYQYQFSTPFAEENIKIDTAFNCNYVKFYSTTATTKGIVLYFHGNKENITRYAKFATNFTTNGYEVWMLDYPTYGKSTGELLEKNFYLQADSIYNIAIKKYSADSIIIFGKSLGTGVASYLASKQKCKHLVLETPYKNMASLVQHYVKILPAKTVLNYSFPVNVYLKKVASPITIFHGTNDALIPYTIALQLKNSLKQTDEFVTITNGTHHNLNDFALFHAKLNNVLK